jgi:uncharacterized protein
MMKFMHILLFPLLSLLLGVSDSVLSQQKNANGYQLGERLPQPKAPQAASSYREVMWEALVPKDWDPAKMLKGLDLSEMDDGDPRAMEALQRIREAWDKAPVEPGMKGARIRIPGFIAPLETKREGITEFLLVPYFGACIHSPPPPSNQTIHVFPAKPVKNLGMMDAVWVSGTLQTTTSKTVFGNAGYRMKAELINPYKE